MYLAGTTRPVCRLRGLVSTAGASLEAAWRTIAMSPWVIWAISGLLRRGILATVVWWLVLGGEWESLVASAGDTMQRLCIQYQWTAVLI
jgi:hypothetical protein